MGLGIGIVGLPNVGKSTLFNALSGGHHATAENYPFCTVAPNHAVVPVPDERLVRIAELTGAKKVTPATVEFVDIAGLVKGASRGEGLGNQFLAHVGECDALLHVVRCFSDENVAHVAGELDPVRDIEIVETELLLRDVDLVGRRVESLAKQIRNEKGLQTALDAGRALLAHLDGGRPVRSFPGRGEEGAAAFIRGSCLVTDKPVVYCANVDEFAASGENTLLSTVRDAVEARGALVVAIAAEMEDELSDLSPDERREFLASYGLAENALAQVVHACQAELGLVSFFTIQSAQAQAWSVRKGTTAPRAAGTIHTDFEHGFIRAEVVSCDELLEHGGESECRAAGVLRTEGKDYEVCDGDVIRFLFST